MSKEVNKLWAAYRERIRSGEDKIALQFVKDTGVPGTYAMVATEAGAPYPLGSIHYRRATKGCWEIVMMLTVDELRGCGICEKILRELIRWAPANGVTQLYTEEVTDKSVRLLKTIGFKKNPDGWRFVLKKPGK